MGEYFQLIKKNKHFDFFTVPQNNPTRTRIPENTNKIIFPNFIFRKLIELSDKFNIRISEIVFYDEINKELQTEINLAIETRNKEKLISLVNENKLDIKSVEFFDKENKTIKIFSNGIIWKEDSKFLDSIISNVIE